MLDVRNEIGRTDDLLNSERMEELLAELHLLFGLLYGVVILDSAAVLEMRSLSVASPNESSC